ncbi:MAG: hypothetical protein ABIN95_10105 [Mucilaginibacter sp.]
MNFNQLKYMHVTICCSLIILFACFGGKTHAQNPNKKSLYYLLDTAKVPVKDRMITIDYEGTSTKIVAVDYTIEVPCIAIKNSRFNPGFIRRVRDEGKVLTG